MILGRGVTESFADALGEFNPSEEIRFEMMSDGQHKKGKFFKTLVTAFYK
jgi:hypothetical protein